MIKFANWYFMLLIPLIIYVFILKNNKKSTIKFSSIKLLKNSGLKKTIKHKIGRYIYAIALILLIIAMARPQIIDEIGIINQNGIDIAMILDVSGSMESIDMEPNRLEVAKKTIDNFIEKRPDDRISLIIFAGTAYTKVPLTLDHNILRESLEQVDTNSVNESNTAIGMAISVGLNRLKKSDVASKIIILVTDGDNNIGAIDPNTASQLAKEFGIKIYTIGIGTDKELYPVQAFGKTFVQQYPGGLNEELLKNIADITGGEYYRAKDQNALSEIFSTINQLEKTEFEQDNFKNYTELAFILIKIALVLLLVGVFLDSYYYIHIP